MKKRAFVIGDVHGMIDELKKILAHWEPETELLIFVGDYIDRGTNSKRVVEKVRQLQEDHGAILIRGNHEEMMLDFLQSPTRGWGLYYMNGGNTTVGQMLDMAPDDLAPMNGYPYARKLKKAYPWLKDWLQSLRYYYEFGNFIVVHAGVDLSQKDWQDTADHDYVWIRDPFLNGANTTGRQIIFGHTPTITLQAEGGLWRQDDKIGIDGGVVYGASLVGVKINEDEIEDIITIDASKE